MAYRGPSSTIIVNFNCCAKSILDDLKLRGTQVSNFLGQWTVEVPVGQEEKYIKILDEVEEVKNVNKHPLYGSKRNRKKLE